MKTILRGIVLNLLLIGLWAFLLFFLYYNAVEERILDERTSGYLGILVLLFILIQMVYLAIFAIKAISRKQYLRSILFLIIVVGLGCIAYMVGFAIMVYLVGVGVGGH